jgi:hypothetical protein
LACVEGIETIFETQPSASIQYENVFASWDRREFAVRGDQSQGMIAITSPQSNLHNTIHWIDWRMSNVIQLLDSGHTVD